MTAVMIDRFLGHPELLGRDFAASSWDNWRIVLRAAFGETLTEAEVESFRDLADGRDPPAQRVRELWLAIGRRAGKDSVASAIATFLAAFGDFKKHLRRGERATVLCLACTKEQASIVFGYIRAYFEEIPALKGLLVSANDGVVTLSNAVEIVVASASFRHLRGKTVAAAIFDEVAFWADENSSNPASEIYTAVIPAMISLREAGAMLIGISTVHRRSGLLFDKVTEYRAKNSEDGLAILAPSVTFNPRLLEPQAQAEIDRELALDPEAASAEWLSRWRDDLSDMFDRELVNQAVDQGRRINFPRSGISYTLAADASGGRGDAFTCAVGHREGDTVIIDRVDEWRPPFDSDAVVTAIADIAAYYRTATVHHDDYGADLLVQAFRRVGLASKPVAIREDGHDYKINRSEIYLDALPLFTAGRIKIPDDPRLIHQLVTLERRPSSSGRDVVDHPKTKNSHDDIANAACACAVLLASRNRLAVTKDALQAAAGRAPPRQQHGVPLQVADPELWASLGPNERFLEAHRRLDQPAPPPERRTALYVTPSLINRARVPGAWSNRGADLWAGGPRPKNVF